MAAGLKLEPMLFGAFRARLEALGYDELSPEDWPSHEGVGCHVFKRRTVGAGTPSVVVRADSDEDVMWPVEIQHALRMLYIDESDFVTA